MDMAIHQTKSLSVVLELFNSQCIDAESIYLNNTWRMNECCSNFYNFSSSLKCFIEFELVNSKAREEIVDKYENSKWGINEEKLTK